MSTYEEDHNIPTNINRNNNNQQQQRNHGRQHQTLSSIIDSFLTSGNNSQPNRDAVTNALRVMNTEEGSSVALDLLDLLQDADIDPATLDGLDDNGKSNSGLSQDFLDSLPRVSINDLPNKDTADCSICTNRFIDDDYPLLVRLPCDAQTVVSGKKTKGHVFDLECIGPWLKMSPTCPLCRFDVSEAEKKRKEKLKEELKKAQEEDEEDEEEDDWDVYG